MMERIHPALDDELPRRMLTPDETAELEMYEQIIHDTVEQVSPVRVPDLAPAVMQRIGRAGQREGVFQRAARGARQWFDWAWSPRPLMVRPAYAVGAILLALGAAVFAVRASVSEQTTVAPEATGAPSVFVHFRIDAPDASEVWLAGDFTDWQPTYTLHESAAGVWSAIVPLEPGVHHYAFFIDGDRWVPDPYAAQVDDGFGGVNSRLAVLLPE